MKITSLIVEGAGRFGAPVSVQGLGEGVNILSAGNEAGKSTLFRALRACVFERHTTSNKSVARLCTEGMTLPLSVTLGFDHKGDAYTIQKCFIRSASASLRKNGVEIARGRQADEELWSVLGIEPGSGRSVDEAAFGLLWVGQGQSFSAPELSGAAADQLNAVVQQEVGTLIGGDRARAVLSTIKGQIEEQLTAGSGRPKTNGPLGRAVALTERLAATLNDMQRRLTDADKQITLYDQLSQDRVKLTDPAAQSRIQTELTEAERGLKQAGDAKTELLKLQSDEQMASVAVANASRILDDLTAGAQRIDESRQREHAISEELKPLHSRRSDAERLIGEARANSIKLQETATENDEAERALNILASARASEARRADLSARQHLFRNLSARLAPVEAELGTNTATADVVEQVDGIERELGTLAARLEAGAAHISIEAGALASDQVRVDGNAIERSISQSLLAPVVIEVGDLAIITATPPAAFGVAEFAKRDGLNTQLASCLSKANAVSAAELRKAHARRRQLESDRAGIMAELKAVGLERNDLASKIERVVADLAAIDDTIAAALKSAHLSELPESRQIEQQLKALALGREAATREHERLNGLVEAQNQIRTDCAAAIGRLEGELDEIQRRRDVDIAMLPDETRDARLGQAKEQVGKTNREHQICAAALLDQRRKTPMDDEIDRLQNRVTRLKSAIDGQRETVGRLDRDIAKLEGQIMAIGAEGLGERVAVISEELDLSTREAERLRTRVEMLVLLRDTVERCYREQRDRLNAPVAKHLQPFLTDLFPNATPQIGDGFAITGLRRDGPIAEPFEILSDGTQEQIAVLVRLAMGSMICERGEPVPIILDDALVFSDDDRIERMFDALSRAGQRQQVIVLTCRIKTFATLGGHQLSIAR